MGHRLNPRADYYIPQKYIPTIPVFGNAPQICFYTPFPYTSQPLMVPSLPPPPPQILTVDYHHFNGHDQPVVVSQPPPQRFITNPSGRTRASHVGDEARNFDNVVPRQQRNNNNNSKRVLKRRSCFDGKSKNVYAKKGDCSSTSHRERRSRSNLGINVDSENATTLMIRNIPSKYTRRMLMEFVDEHCKLQNKSDVHQRHAYDFLYLPIDFRSKLNKGYGFINFTSPEASSTFVEKTNHQKWPFFNSSKIREISYARLQGKDVMMRNYENMRFACREEEFLPVFFKPARDGTNQDLVTEQIIGVYFGNN